MVVATPLNQLTNLITRRGALLERLERSYDDMQDPIGKENRGADGNHTDNWHGIPSCARTPLTHLTRRVISSYRLGSEFRKYSFRNILGSRLQK